MITKGEEKKILPDWKLSYNDYICCAWRQWKAKQEWSGLTENGTLSNTPLICDFGETMDRY